MWFFSFGFFPYPTFFSHSLSWLFLSQCEEEDVSHHAHPIWEDPPLLQRSCEYLSLSMATHDSPSTSLPHTQVLKSPSTSPYCISLWLGNLFNEQQHETKSPNFTHGYLQNKGNTTCSSTGRHSAARNYQTRFISQKCRTAAWMQHCAFKRVWSSFHEMFYILLCASNIYMLCSVSKS